MTRSPSLSALFLVLSLDARAARRPGDLAAWVTQSQSSRAACETYAAEASRIRPATDRAEAEALLAFVRRYPGMPESARLALGAVRSGSDGETLLWDVYSCRIAAFHQVSQRALESRRLLSPESHKLLRDSVVSIIRKEAQGPGFLIQALVLTDLCLTLSRMGMLPEAIENGLVELREKTIEAHDSFQRESTLAREIEAASAILKELRALINSGSVALEEAPDPIDVIGGEMQIPGVFHDA